MKKIIFVFVLNFICLNTNAQLELQPTHTVNFVSNEIKPNSYLWDRWGNSFSFDQIKILSSTDSPSLGGKSVPITSCTAGYYNVYFTPTSGMAGPTPIEFQRRSIICQAFTDISNLIASPLSTLSGTPKINIIIEDLSQFYPSGYLTTSPILASSTAFNTEFVNPSISGIMHNLVWKMIHLGADPLSAPFYSGTSSTNFYHASMAFNFSNSSISYNYNISNTAIGVSDNDFYSIVLHEITHLLGFESQIKGDGNSNANSTFFASPFNYYSNYDRFLKDASNNYLITNGTSTCFNYGYGFNPATNTINLQPACISGSLFTYDFTNCSSAIKFSGTNDIPVYTPGCLNPGNSFCHLEDYCYAPATFSLVPPNSNNKYFVTSNIQMLGNDAIKRYLKEEERIVLCDLGYAVNNVYNSPVAGAFHNYSGANCNGISVAGMNDGIVNSNYTYTATAGSALGINNICANDYNASSFECLEVISILNSASSGPPSGSVNVTSGSSTSTFSFTPYHAGIHTIRYVPVNALGQRGNITYVTIYSLPNYTICNNNPCNLVINGDFENNLFIPYNQTQYFAACGWGAVLNTPDYLMTTGLGGMTIPCNQYGYEPVKIPGTKGYMGIFSEDAGAGSYFNESIFGKLTSPLLPNTVYNLSFDISQGESSFTQIAPLQVYLSTDLSFLTTNTLSPYQVTITNPSMLFTSPTTNSITSGWETAYITFTTGPTAGEQYIVIGNLLNSPTSTRTAAPSPSCAVSPNKNYVFLDNITLNPASAMPTFTPPAVICNTQTLNLNNYVSIQGGTFTGQGVTCSGVNCVFSAASVSSSSVILSYIYTNLSGCTYTLTALIKIAGDPPSFSISASPNVICTNLGQTSTTLTILGSNNNIYFWPALAINASSVVVTPTVNTSYLVTATSSLGCTVSQAISITVQNSCCTQAIQSYSSNTFPASITAISNSYAFNNNVLLPSGCNLTFGNYEFLFAPNVSLTVMPNATLNIVASHLYACNQMWNGILVKPGGVVNITTAGKFGNRTTLIEDARVALDFEPYNALSPTMSNILTAINATFNKNLISIRLNRYDKNQTTYPYTINSCLFTSRVIPYSGLSWPSTNTVKNSASGNTSPLQTPYIDDAAYTPTLLIAPLASQSPLYGININNNGFSNTPTTLGFNFFGATFGTNGNPNFNCFDNLRTDIYAVNSNLTIINSVFQNGRRMTRGPASASGGAIYAESITGLDEPPANNNVINIISGSGNFNNNNRFYEKTFCGTVIGYFRTNIRNAECFSISNNNSGALIPNPLGNLGFNIKTNRYLDIFVRNCKLYNIRNSIAINLDNGVYNVGPYFGTGKLVGLINVDNNIINQHPATPSGTEFCNMGIVVNDLFTASPLQTAPGPVFTSINNNTIGRVANGIEVNNIGFSQVNVYENTITMLNAPSIITTLQNGISGNQNRNAQIFKNNISGPITFTNDISAIKTSMNQILAVQCNTTANTYHGLNFNAAQALTQVQDNIMQNQKYGLSLTNVASIGTQGAPSLPTNNQWLGSWAGNFKTMNQNQFSSAQNSKIYVPWGTALDPNSSSTVIALPGSMNLDDYFHLSSGFIGNTILNSSFTSPSCRLNNNNGNGNNNANGNNGNGNGNQNNNNGTSNNNSNAAFTAQEIALMETFVGNNGFSNGLTPNGKHIHKNHVFRQLKNNPTAFAGSTLLTSFYNQQQSTSLNAYWQIEEQLNQNNKTAAQGIINTLNNTAVVETNYKQFYNLYLKTKDSTFNASDSIALLNIANLCPYDEGGVVYQARALFNLINDTYFNFTNNCSISLGNRLYDNLTKNENPWKINVELKSTLRPNPSKGEFFIDFRDDIKKDKMVEISIYDAAGKMVYYKIEEPAIANAHINENFVKGIYLIKIKNADGSLDIHKIVIE